MYISQVANRLGLNPKTLRYYESVGLLNPSSRSAGKFRIYTETDLERVEFIRNAQKLGLHLEEIREIVSFRDRGEVPCSYVRELIEQKRHEVDQRICELQNMKSILDQLAEDAAATIPGGPEEQEGICHIIENRFKYQDVAISSYNGSSK